MQRISFGISALVAMTAAGAVAQDSVNVGELGVVEAPTAGSRQVPVEVVPRPILHSARVALLSYDNAASLAAAQLDENGTQCRTTWFPSFSPSGPIEKSIRPSENGLPEISYEFSGEQFDVEVRSDGAAAFVEPA